MTDDRCRYIGRCILLGAIVVALAIALHGMWSVELGSSGILYRVNHYTGSSEPVR